MKEIAEKEIKEIKQELDLLKSVTTIKWPFLASLLGRCRIIADSNIETAGVNLRNEMRINPDFLKKLDQKAKAFTYSHEVLHIAFLHCQRGKNRNSKIFNIAADSVVNQILMTHGFKDIQFPNGIEIVKPKKIADIVKKKEEEIAKMSVEEQYHLLEKHLKPLPFKIMEDLKGETEGKSIGDGTEKSKKEKTIQEGDSQGYRPDQSSEERENYWKEALTQAVVQAKMAGTLPADIERIIGELLKPKINWKSYIKKQILDGLGRNTISTWKRTSRKHSLIPGTKQLTTPRVWLLCDTSWSVTEMLSQFLGEIYEIIKNQAKGIIIPWDAKAYPPIELKRKVDLGYAIKKGKIQVGGGTLIAPVLQVVSESIKHNDLTIVITDGEIFDIKAEETQKLLQGVAQRSVQAIFASMDTNISIPAKWQKIQIQI